jgi:hypothetical protein
MHPAVRVHDGIRVAVLVHFSVSRLASWLSVTACACVIFSARSYHHAPARERTAMNAVPSILLFESK